MDFLLALGAMLGVTMVVWVLRRPKFESTPAMQCNARWGYGNATSSHHARCALTIGHKGHHAERPR